MTLIRFACDRCGGEVKGYHTASGTSGFYVVDHDAWGKYRRGEAEHFVCDDCIQSMADYRKDYGLDPKEDA